MDQDSAHHSPWKTADLIFGVPLFLGIGAQAAVPLPWPREPWGLALVVLGVILGVSGLACLVLARREMTALGQPTDPGLATRKLVTTGIFSVSRNPLYLGAGLIFAGVALGFGNPWLVIFLIPALAGCRWWLIQAEENYLAGKFGQEYANYRRSVHRWLGRFSSP